MNGSKHVKSDDIWKHTSCVVAGFVYCMTVADDSP